MAITEFKIRQLVNELAKDILEEKDILKLVGITQEEYELLKEQPGYKTLKSQQEIEWKGADNTPKRVKVNAAAITEELMMHVFYAARDRVDEPLSSMVKAMEALAKIAGLGALEPAAGVAGASTGNTFNLNISWANGGEEKISIGSNVIDDVSYKDYSGGNEGNDGLSVESGDGDIVPSIFISSVFANDPIEEL
jgi:hypothetical protein